MPLFLIWLKIWGQYTLILLARINKRSSIAPGQIVPPKRGISL